MRREKEVAGGGESCKAASLGIEAGLNCLSETEETKRGKNLDFYHDTWTFLGSN